VRLIPPEYVRPLLKTNKHDATDAEAIAEALVRPTMQFALLKSVDQQAVLMLHWSRELLVKQRTMLINAVRGHCSELGMTASQGASRVNDLIVLIETPDDPRLPTFAREALGVLMAQLQAVQEAIRTLERKLQAWHRSQQASQRLTTIPAVGVITATALVATIGDGSQFKSGRHLSAWLGLVRDSTPLAEKVDWIVSPSAATGISGACSFTDPEPCSAGSGRHPRSPYLGLRNYW
jgi:transposase